MGISEYKKVYQRRNNKAKDLNGDLFTGCQNIFAS